jgi:cold shock protein
VDEAPPAVFLIERMRGAGRAAGAIEASRPPGRKAINPGDALPSSSVRRNARRCAGDCNVHGRRHRAGTAGTSEQLAPAGRLCHIRPRDGCTCDTADRDCPRGVRKVSSQQGSGGYHNVKALCLCAMFNYQDYAYMQTGTVKFFNTTRGFGFISPDDGSKDVFVHVSAVERSGLGYLSEGQRVRFEVQRDPRGPKAVNLQAA